MNPTYRKTIFGQAEVSAKSLGLTPRVRSVLIMVDGQRSLEALRAMLGAATDDALAQLLQSGLIEAVAVAPPPPAAAAPAPKPTAPSLDTRRREASRALTEALGPQADMVTLRLERANSEAALNEALTLAVQLLDAVGQRAKAEAFQQRFLP